MVTMAIYTLKPLTELASMWVEGNCVGEIRPVLAVRTY